MDVFSAIHKPLKCVEKMQRSLRCRSITNICWLHCIMVLETLILQLAIGFANAGTVEEKSDSIATFHPYYQYIPPDQQETGTASRESTKARRATVDTSSKDSNLDKSVTIFHTQVDRVESFAHENSTTLGILGREPTPPGFGSVNRTWIDLEKGTPMTRTLVKRNTTKVDGIHVELWKQSKTKRETIPTRKRLRKKRVKRTKKLGEMRNYEQLPPEATKPIFYRMTNKNAPNNGTANKKQTEEHLNGSNGNSHTELIMKSNKEQAQSTMEETIYESQRQARQVWDNPFVYDPEYGDTPSDEKTYENNVYNYKAYDPNEEVEGEIAEYNEDDPGEERELYGESEGGSKGGGGKSGGKKSGGKKAGAKKAGGKKAKPKAKSKKKKPRSLDEAKGFVMNLEDQSGTRIKRSYRNRNEETALAENRKRRKAKAKGKAKSVKQTSGDSEEERPDLNDIDDRAYFDGGHDHPGHHAGPDHIVRDYDRDDDYFDSVDYGHLQRTKRESGNGEEGSKANTFDKSFGLRSAQDHAKTSWARTPLNRLALSVNSIRTGISVATLKPVNPLETSKRTIPPVTVNVTTPAVVIALCSKNICANGGTCLRSSIRESICLCPTGYSGKTCENRSDPCIGHPCQNGATCTFADKTLPMRCQCPAGFTGKLCQIDVNECSSDPCLNGARCTDQVDGYSCKCLLGFEGQRCEANTDDCLGRICANGGRCIDGLNRHRCQCRPGFFGRHCQGISDACLRRPCFNGGECIAMDSRGHFYKCLCRTGYLGARCEIQAATCVHNWCKNGGTCMEAAGSFQCLCPSGLTGNLCESEVNIGVHKCQPDVCQRRGSCVYTFPGYRCECPIEAVGDRCQFDRDACLPNPCVNGGLCIPTGGPFYFCLCDQRFAGKICQFETRSCAGNKTCENGGTCLEYHLQRRLNRYLPCVGRNCRSVKQNARKELTVIRCVCPLLYTGPRCTVRNLPCTIGVCAGGQECKEDPHNPIEGYSCLDRKQSEVALEGGANQNDAIQEGHEGWVKVSNAEAILFGAAMIVAIFGFVFFANGYTKFRSKKDNLGPYQPAQNEQRHVISEIRAQMDNPGT